MFILSKVIQYITETAWSYKIFNNSNIRVSRKAKCIINKNSKITNSNIYIAPDSTFIVGENVDINNVDIYIDGVFSIDEHTIIGSNIPSQKSNFIVDKASVSIGSHSKLSCKRVWARFGGVLSIGNYTNINEWSEIRCDDRVEIGSYNQISYNVRIWDTNTHNIYTSKDRRRITESKFPYFGFENERPNTKRVIIGDDCWIGENCGILKGTTIGNETIVGYNTVLIGKSIPNSKTVVTKIEHIIK